MENISKDNLERRYNFLLLQLKIIHETIDMNTLTYENMVERLGAIAHYSDPQIIKDKIHYIETFNKKYNFYNETMNID